MPDIVTRCPTCETAFRVTEEQLGAANGMVRCGKCIGIFNAPANQVSIPDPEESLPHLTALIHNEFSEQQPSPPAKFSLTGLLAKVAVLALGGLVLAGQYIYFFSGPLSQNQDYRQLLMDGCEQLGCRIEPFRDLDKLAINTFIVQSHPTQPNAVMVDMLVENSAEFSQAYPGIKIRFEDLNGQLVSQRIFSPRDYLPRESSGPASAIKNISSGRQAHISFSLVDPGLSAVSYQVELSH